VKANDVALTVAHSRKGAAQRPRPTRVGRYQLGEMLGAGGMGVVYRAHDPDLDRAVAIKVVHTGDASSGARLLREAQAMARLRHPNVVPIFDVGPAEDAVFVAMPLLEGGTLKAWLHGGPRGFAEILDRFVAAGRGLAAAHAAGLVHRDFKPENVLLGAGGETQVSDFGIACLAGDEAAPSASVSTLASGALTETGDVLGTPDYMAPEQLRGRPSDARADQFSFCIALWEGIYGERPFLRSTADTTDPMRARMDAIAAGPVAPPRRDHPAWIAQLLVRGLAEDPERRWPTLQALLDAIDAYRASRRWRRWLAAGLGAAGLAAAIVAQAWPAPMPIAPQVSVVSLTHRGDLKRAAISPDGSQLALVAGDALVIRGIEPDAEDRVVVDHGIADEPIAWSPDGKHLLAGTVPETAPLTETVLLVDIDRGTQHRLPVTGMATFLSSTEVAVTSYRQRSIAILPVAEHATATATATATCDVPGDYTFLWNLAGLPDGTMIVQTRQGETNGLVILRRNCQVRATFSAEPISSVAVSDTGGLVALIAGDGSGEILEISLDGVIVSRRRVSGDLGEILGRRHGTDYVSTLALKTHLDRIHGGSPPQRQFSVNGGASFSLAPDGETLAWIELGSRARGPLRLSSLPDLSRRGRPLRDHALMVGWSPDGRSLAVLVDDDDEVAIVVVDRTGAGSRRLPLDHLAREAAPVWLDDHRIAAQTDDRTTYRWFDLRTGAQGQIVDRLHGSTYWLARSPRDGMLAMWRNGAPGAAGAADTHLWVQPVGHEARPLHVEQAIKYHLLPSWSPSGELLVCALETGELSRVTLDTGALTPIAQLPATPVSRLFDDHLMTLTGGDLLAVEIELGINVLAVRPDDELRPRRGGDPGHDRL
jgi:WD40 repeat protein